MYPQKIEKLVEFTLEKTTFSPTTKKNSNFLVPKKKKKQFLVQKKSLDAIMESSRRTALAHMKGGNETPHNVVNISIVNNC
jgi:hypothetical protein